MHSGQNPSSGLGISRCLREAFPSEKIELVGVDHWQGSSGLHHPVTDESLLLPNWNHLNSELHAQRIREILEEGNAWLSALDLEVRWINDHLEPHPLLLSPSKKAVESSAKPKVFGFESMGFRVPRFISANISDTEIHAFLRENSWKCWLKSPFHDAVRITSWNTFQKARLALSKQWKTQSLFLQVHSHGTEETICFSAYQGELLDAIHMIKRQITPEGKTWAGEVSLLSGPLRERLAECVRQVGWNGGGELELIRSPSDQFSLIECNPRFPAWVYGGALAGFNLPARLVARAFDIPWSEVPPVPAWKKSPLFTRVVLEIPASPRVGLPLPQEPTHAAWTSEGKGGKGGPSVLALPELREHDKETEETEENQPSNATPQFAVPPLLRDEMERLALAHFTESQLETPTRIPLPEWTRRRFEALKEKVADCSSENPKIEIGFSIKTSPTPLHLALAKENGFFAEAISQLEVQRALETGFPASRTVLNGPGKFWPSLTPPVMGLHQVFCDSVEELERVLVTPQMAKTLGVRIRIPGLRSRFGIPVEDPETFQKLIPLVKKIGKRNRFGIHFHMPGWAIGLRRWAEALGSLLSWAQTLEALTHVPIYCLDLGGGLFPDDLERLDFREIQKTVARSLPNAKELFFEPGRALTQEGEMLATRVLDVRKSALVVDACIAELPLSQSRPRSIFILNSKTQALLPLSTGKGQILGRICMEDDIIADGVELPDGVARGDVLILGDAGAYERSMSYVFGRG